MKIFKTINWSFLNLDELYKVDHEDDKRIQSYFHMKNGEKYDVYDMPDQFNIDDEKIYVPCAICHVVMNQIILENILRSSELDVYDISQNDDRIWEQFINWARHNPEKLRELIATLH